jgi:hypothetical protein
MTSQLELTSRAALCRQLAKREPANGVLWMAEAENWLRHSKENFRSRARKQISSGVLASLRVRSVERFVSSRVSKNSR